MLLGMTALIELMVVVIYRPLIRVMQVFRGTSLQAVHGDNAGQDKQTSCPESPGGRILEEKNPYKGGENHLAGH